MVMLNTYAAALTIQSMQFSGDTSDFTVSGCVGGKIPSQQSCQFNVTFAPTQPGPRAATLTINDTGPTSPQIVSVTGIGSELSVSNVLAFNRGQTVGTSSTKPLTLTNNGTTSISINSVQAVGGDFQITTSTCPASLAPAASCSLTVQFTPSVAGQRWGAINITDSDPGSPHQTRVAGTGVAGAAAAVTVSEEEMMRYQDDEGEDD
jgi:hypothetical protein